MDLKTLEYYNSHAKDVVLLWESAVGAAKYFPLAIPAKSKVLDIGCGSGRDAAILLSQGFAVTGVEPSPKLRQTCEQLHPQLAGHMKPGSLPDELLELGSWRPRRLP